MSKRVCIVGTASCSMGATPWDAPDTLFWGIASVLKNWPENAHCIDTWFEIHPNFEKLRPEWLVWAKEHQPHVYMAAAHPELVNSEVYPLEEAQAQFGNYFTSSVAYMLALAIMRKPEWIGLYGVDMATGSEYFDQRPCCEYLIGYARGAGIEVDVPKSSSLMKSPWLYGYDVRRPTKRKARDRDELGNWRTAALAIRDRWDPEFPLEDLVRKSNGGIVFHE